MHGGKQEYRELLRIVSKYFEIVRLMDGEGERQRCFLRHDVDRDFTGSQIMAQIEKDMQIHSTYFMLHTTSYYKENGFLEKCNLIQDMGHEIGLHNSVIEAYTSETKSSYKEIFERELKYLREGGIEIHGVANHIGPYNRRMGFVNYQIFKECYRPYLLGHQPEGVPTLHTLSLKEYGLYEAYFLPACQDCYISDTGSCWRYVCGDGQDEWHPKYLQTEEEKDIKKIIRMLSKRNDIKNIQLLTHPCWWDLNNE